MTLTTAQTTQIKNAWATLKHIGKRPVSALIRDQLAETMTPDEMAEFANELGRDAHEKARGEWNE